MAWPVILWNRWVGNGRWWKKHLKRWGGRPEFHWVHYQRRIERHPNPILDTNTLLLIVSLSLSLSLSLVRILHPMLYYIRTCTDISICPLHLGSTRPWACRALHATKVSDYKQLSLQLHFDVVAEHCYTRAVSQQTPTDKWQQLQQQGQPAHSSMTLQAYTGTNWPHHSSMVTTVSTRIGNTSS